MVAPCKKGAIMVNMTNLINLCKTEPMKEMVLECAKEYKKHLKSEECNEKVASHFMRLATLNGLFNGCEDALTDTEETIKMIEGL